MEHPSGWFPDPLGRYDHRWFNGHSWTSDVSSDGRRFVDPLGITPSPVGPSDTGNGAATAAVVMGSVGVAIAWIPFLVVVGLVLAVLAIVFGVRGLRRSRTTGTGRGASIAGTVMGALGVVASIAGVVLSIIVWNAVVDFVEPGRHEIGAVTCVVDGRRVDVAGEITNLGGETRSYTVFVDVRGEIAVATVPDVPAGATTGWSTTATMPSVVDECDPDVTVQGAFPFGIELDPVGGAIGRVIDGVIDGVIAGAIASMTP